ncbi:MAG: VCBS repeat-containing protein, partial [Candidatus Poribacteria bacterium]|nr:VCBS repeat-containing protein [Candidatus Poribacteria bacterium]
MDFGIKQSAIGFQPSAIRGNVDRRMEEKIGRFFDLETRGLILPFFLPSIPKLIANIIFCCLLISFNAAAQNLLPPGNIKFTNITQAAGIDFIHNTGAFGKKYLPETMGSGCAFIDYDNDGWQDILLVNGKDWEGKPTQKRQTMALYRNNRDSTFTDVTETAGLATRLYGMGVAVADYDNDGDSDIYISTLET